MKRTLYRLQVLLWSVSHHREHVHGFQTKHLLPDGTTRGLPSPPYLGQHSPAHDRWFSFQDVGFIAISRHFSERIPQKWPRNHKCTFLWKRSQCKSRVDDWFYLFWNDFFFPRRCFHGVWPGFAVIGSSV